MELVNDSGWRGARLPEIRGAIYAKLAGLLGKISGKGDAVIGQIIAVCSEEDLQIIEAMGWIYGGYFISQGEGAQLDGAGEWFNTPRNGLVESAAYVLYLLKSGDTVSAGDTFQVSGISGDWEVSETKIADENLCAGLVLAVNESALVEGNTFVLSVSGTNYTTQFEDGDTSDTIISRLYGLVIAGNSSMTTTTTAYGELLYSADGQSNVVFNFADTVFDVVRIAVPEVAYYASETEFPIVSYGDIVSDDVLVLSAGSQGYLIEDDESYRARLQEKAASQKKESSASRPGIKDVVLAVEGVSYCEVSTNRGIQTDADGLPGKSVQVFVAGGADDDVAQAIWEGCAAECNTYGTSSGTAKNGDVSETMYFTRQEYESLFVTVTDDTWDEETTGRPDDYDEAALEVVNTYFSSLIVGRDVFAKQIESQLMVAFPTMTDVTVYVGTSANPADRVVSIGDGVIATTTTDQIVIDEAAA